MYDIGAFEGVMALFFACRPGQVIACEPNPRICHMHLNNLDNMQVMARGISGSTSTIEMVYEHLMPGVGSGEPAITEQITSSAFRYSSLRD